MAGYTQAYSLSSRLVWDDPDKRLYETGIDRGVFYPQGGVGISWNGLISVSENPSGADVSENHYDGEKYRFNRGVESFSANLEAYTYPIDFQLYDGTQQIITQQNRKYFGLSYRTFIGNTVKPDSGYKIHLVYNALASPSSKSYNSMGDSVDPIKFSWDISTIPVLLSSGEITSHLIIDSTIAYPWALTTLEDILYGSGFSDPRLPSINEVLGIFEDASILKITDHGDGRWTADGPSDAIRMLDATTFEITWPSAVYIDDVTYRISSL